MSMNLVDLPSEVKTSFHLLDESRSNQPLVSLGEMLQSTMKEQAIEPAISDDLGQSESGLLKKPKNAERLLCGLVTKSSSAAPDRERATPTGKKNRTHTDLSPLYSKLKTREQEQQAIMDSVEDIIILLDHQGRIKDLNRHACQLVKTSRKDLVDLALSDFLGNDFECCGSQNNPTVIKAFHRVSQRWFKISMHSLDQGSSSPQTTVVMRDITIHRGPVEDLRPGLSEKGTHATNHHRLSQKTQSLAETLRHQDRIVLLGNAAVSQFHEIRDAVTTVAERLDELDGLLNILEIQDQFREILDIDESRRTQQTGFMEETTETERECIHNDANLHLQEARKRVNSIKAVIKNVYAFSENDHDQVAQVNLHLCLKNCLRFLAHEFNGKITVLTDFSIAIPEIRCSSRALNQVILSLLMNAIHAVEGFGNILISTYCEEGHVCFQIEDNGIDLQRQHQDGLVEPGHAGPHGRGTWPALYVPEGDITDLGGQLIVERIQNLWSRYIVKLPQNSSIPPVVEPDVFK